MSATITFLGGADTVTGSKYLIEHNQKRLLVDCGLFQGYKQLRLRNWNPLPANPANIDAVVLTHAHLDHSGYIQEEDAFFANRHGFSKHAPALPLYTKQEAIQSLRHLHAERQGQWFEPIRGWKARFQPAGHILGAASLLLDVGGRRILFSGDLGRPDDPLMNPPEPPPQADTV
ncbi:MAG: MBL fold metallo-hydrolase, partial [Burkholderiales bacterium]